MPTEPSQYLSAEEREIQKLEIIWAEETVSKLWNILRYQGHGNKRAVSLAAELLLSSVAEHKKVQTMITIIPCEHNNSPFMCPFCLQERAIDAEEKLDAARRELAARWVPCSERLPDVNVIVIIHGGIGRWDGTHWITETSGAWGCPIEWEVTHWRPLPSPPAAQEKSE